MLQFRYLAEGSTEFFLCVEGDLLSVVTVCFLLYDKADIEKVNSATAKHPPAAYTSTYVHEVTCLVIFHKIFLPLASLAVGAKSVEVCNC